MTPPRRRGHLSQKDIQDALGLGDESEFDNIRDPAARRLLGRAAIHAINLQKALELEKARAEALKARLDQAEIDPVTGLLTRSAFLEKSRQLESNLGYVVAMIDLRGFKAVNDRYSHAAGDRLLAGAATTLVQKGVRFGSLVGRWGGDEFAMVIPFDELPEVEAVMDRLHNLFSGEETAEICAIDESTAVYLSGRVGHSVIDRAEPAVIMGALETADAILTEQGRQENGRGKMPKLVDGA